MPGVYDRRMFRMANGGMMPPEEAMMMPPEGGMMPPPGGMDPQAQQLMQQIDAMPPEMQQAEAAGFFQQALQGGIEEAVGQEVGRSIQDVESATGFRDIMNAVWDEDADVESYRARLAEVVGPDDAARTPDSVLALVQPTLQLAQLDQGIGALMQQELAEVGGAGAMGGGITELATKSAVADGMAAETGALVNAVGGMAQAPMDMGMAQAPMPMGPEFNV
jgi:hypothetical protein|tara:strand:+ start:1550 stop:2209 length:660 start_codon:yes stop_codon:yes gene_type:complete